MKILKIKSLAGLDGPVLDMIAATLKSLASRDSQPMSQRAIWSSYHVAVQRFRQTGNNYVDLPRPNPVDYQRMARIARLHVTEDGDPQAAFWNELAKAMESIRVR
jgi:hypothetical protein